MINDGINHLSIDKSFRIKQDDEFFLRLKSKEASSANTSSRVMYYGETSIAIPFVWEAQPGTPKHPLSETSIPPLTPPPSYYSKKSNTNNRNSKINIFSCILSRLVGSRKTTHASPTSSRSSSSSSSSSSSYSYSMRDNNQGSFSSSCSSTIVGSFLKHKGSKRI